MKPERFEVYRIGGRYVCVTEAVYRSDDPARPFVMAMVGCIEVDGRYVGSKFGIPRSEFKPERRVTQLIESEPERPSAEEIVRRRMESGRTR